MPDVFNNIFGIHEQALHVRTKRAELLANNIANSDTPGYKARDLNFKDVLRNIQNSDMGLLNTTHHQHVNGMTESGVMQGLMYRSPMQPSIDGNTVDMHIEKAQFTENAMRYNASFTFLNGRIKGILGALRGD